MFGNNKITHVGQMLIGGFVFFLIIFSDIRQLKKQRNLVYLYFLDVMMHLPLTNSKMFKYTSQLCIQNVFNSSVINIYVVNYIISDLCWINPNNHKLII